ncbi:hypothetical protein, partial [Bifidobacterium dentium]|uniref:hypothetical protein n=1 Tax=Bifidobacterium dentium TaxID=1689 RepID=UPI00398CFF61
PNTHRFAIAISDAGPLGGRAGGAPAHGLFHCSHIFIFILLLRIGLTGIGIRAKNRYKSKKYGITTSVV